MHGNVWEWCNTWYHNDPRLADNPRLVGSARVLRGGSWGGDASFTRAANRNFDLPAFSFNLVGFRVARALP